MGTPMIEGLLRNIPDGSPQLCHIQNGIAGRTGEIVIVEVSNFEFKFANPAVDHTPPSSTELTSMRVSLNEQKPIDEDEIGKQIIQIERKLASMPSGDDVLARMNQQEEHISKLAEQVSSLVTLASKPKQRKISKTRVSMKRKPKTEMI